MTGLDCCLLFESSFNLGDKVEGASALWSAAAAGFHDVVRYLVSECKANVNGVTSTNSTPLRAACYDGRMQIVRFLVEEGANLEIANRHGHTSLMIACYRGHIEIVKYLLGKGATVNRRSIKGKFSTSVNSRRAARALIR